MNRMRASRGDVAKSTAGNANLQKMMAQTKFVSLLKRAGQVITGEQIAALNETLQSIPKKK